MPYSEGDPRSILVNFSSQIRRLPMEAEQRSKLASFTLSLAKDRTATSDILWGEVQNLRDQLGLIYRGRIGGSGKGSNAYESLNSTSNITSTGDRRSFFNRNVDDINNVSTRNITSVRDGSSISSESSMIASAPTRRIGGSSVPDRSSNISNAISAILTAVQHQTRKNKLSISTSNWFDQTITAGNTCIVKVGQAEIIKGFIDEGGLGITVNNKYHDLFGEGFFAAMGKAYNQFKILGDAGAAAAKSLKENKDSTKSKGQIAQEGLEAAGKGLRPGKIEKAGVILNTAIYYAGSEPLNFSLKIYAIAKNPGEILDNYKKALMAVSPSLKGGKALGGINWGVEQPEKASIILWDNLKITEAIIESLTCTVRGPFDVMKSPVIGEYDVKGKSIKIVDKKYIDDLFDVKDPGKAVRYWLPDAYI